MTREQAKQLVYSELDNIRSVTCATAERFHARTDSYDRWIATASKKELLAELICLFANNHHN